MRLGRFTLPIKEVLLLIALGLGAKLYIMRLDSVGDALAPYLLLFVFCLVFIVLAAYSDNRAVRLFWGSIIAISSAMNEIHFGVMGSEITYNSFIQLYESRGFAYEAFQQYFYVIAGAIPAALVLFFGFLIKPKALTSLYKQYKPRLIGVFLSISPLVPIVGLSLLLFFRSGNGGTGLPVGIVVPVYAGLLTYEQNSNVLGDRQAVSIDLLNSRPKKDIVFIVDESLRGDYIDINNPSGARSGLAEKREGVNVYNYGFASSATNCSVGSNLVLRYGGTRQDYLRYINTMPSIWAYAKKAGYKAIYIDAQSEEKFYNGMDDTELAEIEEIIQFHEVLPRDKDIESAKVLAELINDGIPQFILVNKLGEHFPVNDKFPDEYLKYRPSLPRGNFERTTIGKLGASFDGSNWDEYKNSYKNTIEWSLGHYFDVLLETADLDKATIIYTSDHGQNFHERGEPGIHTHCSSKGTTSIEEGLVPLVVLTGDSALNSRWGRGMKLNFNKTTHYSIFATLLVVMGYEEQSVNSIYGASMFDRVREPFAFNTQFFARLGQKPVWKKIELNKIISPSN